MALDREVIHKKYSSLEAAWETTHFFKLGFGLLCPILGEQLALRDIEVKIRFYTFIFISGQFKKNLEFFGHSV